MLTFARCHSMCVALNSRCSVLSLSFFVCWGKLLLVACYCNMINTNLWIRCACVFKSLNHKAEKKNWMNKLLWLSISLINASVFLMSLIATVWLRLGFIKKDTIQVKFSHKYIYILYFINLMQYKIKCFKLFNNITKQFLGIWRIIHF